MHANRTLTETARQKIEDGLDTPSGRVLLWDDGGFLEDTVESVCRDLDVELRKAEDTPLELRKEPSNEPQVWYVPHEKDGYDWFRDIENTGYEEEISIEHLAVLSFGADNASSWELEELTRNSDDRGEIARVIYDELTGATLPTFEELKTSIITGGNADPVRFILRDGWSNTSTDEGSVNEIRDLLVEEGVEVVRNEADPDEIVRQTRRWAVAEWLIHSGVDPDLFPEEYSASSGGMAIPSLKAIVNEIDGSDEETAEDYLSEFWWDVLEEIEDPWDGSECPVDGALDALLWNSWKGMYDDGRYEECAEKAEARSDALRNAFGEVPWARTWEQAFDIATLADKIDSWSETETDDVVEIYADEEDGTWRIDRAVLSLVVSGEPETSLPAEHPPVEFLDDLRTGLIEHDYVDYLKELGSLTAKQVEEGAPFVDHDHAHRFFYENKEEEGSLESGRRVALFVIDALRMDLARELADALRDHETLRDEDVDYEIDEETWLGPLPSETEFGKGALTPGGHMGFEISLDGDDLTPKKNGQKLTNYRRENLLEEEGWTVIRDDKGVWDSRVVYYSNDLDDMGEKGLEELESLLSQRVQGIADMIAERLDQGRWDHAYVLTDHGFVNLPTSVNIEGEPRPDGTVDSSRRWIAGEGMQDGPGVLLDGDARLGYLEDDVNILADPTKRFEKQGLGDSYFYHGGIMPQEFVLDLISITKE
jgi:hypothetical protein